VNEAFKKVTKRYPHKAALRVKRNGEWITWTFRQYYSDVARAAKSMVRLGLEPHHGVCILGFNAPEWFIGYMAGIMAGGISCGIYATNNPEAWERGWTYLVCPLIDNMNLFHCAFQVCLVHGVQPVKSKCGNNYTRNILCTASCSFSETTFSKILLRWKGLAPRPFCCMPDFHHCSCLRLRLKWHWSQTLLSPSYFFPSREEYHHVMISRFALFCTSGS